MRERVSVARISKREHRAPSPPAKLYLLSFAFHMPPNSFAFSHLRPLARGSRYNMCKTDVLLLKGRKEKLISSGC